MRKISILTVSFFLASAATAQQLGDSTQLMHDSQHGTQIEYLDSSGGAFLWYPGNRSVVPGQWKRDGSDICFAYGGNTYNPATGHRGGGWECMPFDLYLGAVKEQMSGDIFSLARQAAVPFRLDPERTTLEQLLGELAAK